MDTTIKNVLLLFTMYLTATSPCDSTPREDSRDLQPQASERIFDFIGKYPSLYEGYNSNPGDTYYSNPSRFRPTHSRQYTDNYGFSGYGSNYEQDYQSLGRGYQNLDPYYPEHRDYHNGPRALPGYGGYGGYGGNGGLPSYEGYNYPDYYGNRNVGYGYYANTDENGFLYRPRHNSHYPTGYRGYS